MGKTVPPDVELHHTLSVAEQGYESMASNNLRTNLGHSNVGGQDIATVNPGQNWESGTNPGSEIHNPPMQVMERPGDPAPNSSYKIPSHVFDRTTTNAPVEWSTASNESLFSIHMGTMSFSRELTWLGKSGDLDKLGDMTMPNPINSFPSNLPPGNKFNDMSQRTAEQDQFSGVTEAKAAETMREVIRENTEKNSKEGLSSEDGTSHSNVLSNPSNQPHHSDGSAQSFAVQPLKGDGDKSAPSSGSKEKPKKQKHSDSGPQSSKETTDAAQVPTSNSNASKYANWLSCFGCCPFCH